MLRVHFTTEDLLRTRLAAEPAPLMELGLALAMAQRGDTGPVFTGWRQDVRAGLPRAARPLLELIPDTGAGPFFLDPLTERLDEGMELVLAAPRTLVHTELRRVFPPAEPVTPWVRRLEDHDREAWQLLELALRAAHHSVLGPTWARVRASYRADLVWRGRLLAERGIRETLTTLYPGSRWQGAVLEIDSPRHLEVFPAGRGVTLMPSAFWTGPPLMGDYTDGSELLIYPALTPFPLVDPEPDGDPLAALLGRNRAAVLRSAVAEHTTGELAREVGISAASVSEHTKTLRTAGLLVTERAGKAVWHSCTPLGLRLLAG